MKRFLAVLIVVFCFSTVATAQAGPTKTINILGREEAVVTKDTILLGDIVNISSRYVKDDEAMIALKKIDLGTAPGPGKERSISAARVLERMREEGVDLNAVGYRLPRLMSIKRASRPITKQEVEIAIQDALERSGRDGKLQSVTYKEPVHVLPGVMSLEVSLQNGRRVSEMRAVLTATVQDAAPIRFTVPALVQEWTEVPVAKRPLYKGAIVGHDDIMMARLSTEEIPEDAARDTMNIIGFETSRPISYGEVFRKKKLEIPPLVHSGEKITLRYQSRFLEATATGVAIEDGIAGQKIRIRNDRSRKVITGTVIEEGLVGVQR